MSDPREEPTGEDKLAAMIADLDQHLANAPHIGRLLAGEWQAVKDEGVPPMVAAVLIGTRWSAS